MKTKNINQSKPRKVRGTAIIRQDDSFEFTPYNEAPSTQQNVRTCVGGGKSWTTTGAQPSKVVHLMCKEGSPDVYAELLTQFNALTKDLKPKQPKQLPERQRVMCEQGLEAWLNQAQGTLTFTGTIDLSKSRNWQAAVMQLTQLIVRSLPMSEKFTKLVTKLKKGV